MKFAAILIASMFAVLMVPMAAGHAAPPARDFETRLIHDSNDDSAVVLAGKHGFDAIALDVRTGFSPTGETSLILRLLLNGGCKSAPESPDPAIPQPPNPYGACPDLKHVVEFTLNGTVRQAEFVSTEFSGQNWTGSMSHYVGPNLIGDGTRFAMEGYYPLMEEEIGMTATEFFVYGYSGDEVGDNMPELVPGMPDPREETFNTESFVIPDPNIYFDLQYGLSMVEAGGELSFTVASQLSANQVLNISTVGPIEFINPDGGNATDPIALSSMFSRNMAVRSTGHESAPAQLIVTSDHGGYGVINIQVMGEVEEQGGAVSSPTVPVGTTWTYTFSEAGLFTYHNHLAPSHDGSITVMGEGSGETHTIVYDGGFTPRDLEINVGDTVVFENNSTLSMMVMGSFGESHGEHGEHNGEQHGTDEGKDSPGIGVVVLLAALAAIVIARRRS